LPLSDEYKALTGQHIIATSVFRLRASPLKRSLAWCSVNTFTSENNSVSNLNRQV